MALIYIPGHAGIRYNEWADWLAGIARPQGDIQLTQGDLLSMISDGIREQELQQPTFALDRLMEEEVSPGTGAKLKTRGEERSLVTQLTMGVFHERSAEVVEDT